MSAAGPTATMVLPVMAIAPGENICQCASIVITVALVRTRSTLVMELVIAVIALEMMCSCGAVSELVS